MKKIFNWTLGSFFRTFGRIFAYLVIAFAIFLIIEKTGLNGLSILRLNASTTNQVYYNYNDEFVVNHVESSWFGSEGTLESIKTKLQENSINGILGFGSNGIFFIPITNSNYLQWFYSQLGTDYANIRLSFYNNEASYITRKIFYYSNYNSVNNFVSSISNNNGGTKFCNNANYCSFNLVSSSTSDDFRTSNFNIWEQELSLWNIIYYIQGITLTSSCGGVGYSCRNWTTNDISINGSTSFISYYDLRGNIAPNEDINKTLVYNSFITIDTEHIDEISGWFQMSLSNGDNPIVSDIKIYGLINDSGLYHYEELNSSIISFKNSNPNYGTTGYDYSSSTGGILNRTYENIQNVLYISSNAFNYTDLSSYEEIYIKIEYEEPFYINIGTFRTELDSPYIKQMLINDVCSNCLFLQLTSQGNNTYTFSNSNSNDDTQLYYTNILNNDVVFNKPVFFSLSSKTIYSSDVRVISNKYYYDTFYKVLFDNYSIANDTGLLMNIYMNDLSGSYNLSGSYQMLYYITPNLYWSDSIYTYDRNSISGKATNDNGDTISFTINDDFHNYISEITSADKYFNIISGIISDDFYGLSGLILKPLEYISQLSSKVCSSIILPIPFTNSNLTIPCMSTIYNTYIPDIILLWHIVIYGVLSYAIGVNLFKTIKDSMEADKNDVEVLDL